MADVVPFPRKRRTRGHVIADQGVNYVERFIYGAGFTSERVRHDYGVDLNVITYDAEGFLEAGYLPFQVKASERHKESADGSHFVLDLDVKHVNSWLNEPMPVFLVLYEAATRRAYWLYVQRTLRTIRGAGRGWARPACESWCRRLIALAEGLLRLPAAARTISSANRTRWIMDKPITLADLDATMRALGFEVDEVPDSHRLYRHERGARIMLPNVPLRTEAKSYHLTGVRAMLDDYGFVGGDEFHELVRNHGRVAS